MGACAVGRGQRACDGGGGRGQVGDKRGRGRGNSGLRGAVDVHLDQAGERVQRHAGISRRRAEQIIAIGVYEVAGGVGHEGAVAGQEDVVVGVLDDEIAAALHRHVGGRRRLRVLALEGVEGQRRAGHAVELRLRVLRRIDEGGEFGLYILVACGIGVGDILPNRRQPVGVGLHAGDGSVEDAHGISSRVAGH